MVLIPGYMGKDSRIHQKTCVPLLFCQGFKHLPPTCPCHDVFFRCRWPPLNSIPKSALPAPHDRLHSLQEALVKMGVVSTRSKWKQPFWRLWGSLNFKHVIFFNHSNRFLFGSSWSWQAWKEVERPHGSTPAMMGFLIRRACFREMFDKRASLG